MKIKKIIIHNLASIPDSTLDFQQQPLSTADVFLITGNTGSGKSTILDAICLALYGKTPRFNNTKMQGKLNDVTLSDPRQLLSKGAGEGFAELHFIGNNGIEYVANWTVRRARNKADGNLQDKTWTLKNLSTNQALTKDKEIEAEIDKAIGLDFQQFCRTTILPQGDFTKFLDSNDNEKAEILEKITGIDIYSKISQKVHEKTSESKNKWEQSKLLLGNITVLSDEEVNEINANLKTIGQAIKDLGNEIDNQTKKHTWFEAENKFEGQIKTAETNLQNAEAATKTETFLKDGKLVEDWNTTITIRQELRKKNDAEKTINDQNVAIEQGKNEFVTLLSGQLFLQEALKNAQEEKSQLNAYLDANHDRKTIFGNAQTIAAELKKITDGRDAIAKENTAINAANQNLNGALKVAFDAAKKAYDQKDTAFQSEQQKLKAEEVKLQGLALTKLRDELKKITSELHDLDMFKTKVQIVFSEQTRREQSSQKLDEQEKRIGELAKQLENEIKPKLHNAKIVFNAQKEAYDKQYESASDWARKMRAQLHQGDVCPVCGQKISDSLPHEEDVAQLVKGLKEARDKAEKAYNDLKDQKGRLETELSTTNNSYEDDKKAFAADKTLDNAMADALKAGVPFGITSIDDMTESKIVGEVNARNSKLTSLNSSIQQAEGVEKEVGNLRTSCDTLRKDVEAAKRKVDEAQKAIDDCKAAIKASNKLVGIKEAEVKTAENEVARHLGRTTWDADWKSETAQFAAELNSKAIEYAKKDARYSTTTTNVANYDRDSQEVVKAVTEIVKLVPDWADLKATAPKSVDDIIAKSGGLRVRVSNATTLKSSAETTLSNADAELNQWLYDHVGFQIADLSRLNGYDQNTITGKDNQLRQLQKNVNNCTTILKQILSQKATHDAEKPVLNANDTVESVAQCVAELKAKENVALQEKGKLEQQLATDKANKRNQQTLLDDASKKEAEYLRWEKLNSLIGSATGSNFRKIAQTYLLVGLVEAANGYMRTLSDRYTLRVEPSTFIITIEDAYQGFARRSASTISGGETFLVSLSLALALSDFGNNLSVDTLFIDEGFGTLSGEPLQNAIATLRSLHTNSGRKVGIISHVEELQECIPVQIKVKQNGNSGCSSIEVIG